MIKTVLPLPTHASSAYEDAPGLLEDDPVYRQHPEDWQNTWWTHLSFILPGHSVDSKKHKKNLPPCTMPDYTGFKQS